MALLGLIHGNLIECQKKILKIELNQIAKIELSLPDGSMGTNVISLGAEVSYLCMLMIKIKIS